MSDLKKYQSDLVNNIIYHFENPSQDLLENIIPIGKITPKEVIGVYATDYNFRMLEAMQTQFEAVWMVMGDEAFKALIFEFIKVHTSNEVDLNLYGKIFPDFLKSKNEILEELPFLSELARFEVCFWEMFHQQNPKNVERELFTDEIILNSKFNFDETMFLFQSDFNIFPLFQFKDKDLKAFFEKNEPTIVNQSAFYLLHKKNDRVIVEVLSPAQYNFFQLLIENKCLISVINLGPEITEVEIIEIFKLISTNFLNKLKINE